MLRDFFGLDELLPNEWLTHSFRSQFCKPEERRFVCLNALYSVTGFDKEQVRYLFCFYARKVLLETNMSASSLFLSLPQT